MPVAFIFSANVHQFKRHDKETWYLVRIETSTEPIYSVQRRYQDFIDLANQLTSLFPGYPLPSAPVCKHRAVPAQVSFACWPCIPRRLVFGKRKWRLHNLNRYLTSLFGMPLEVCQSSLVYRFFSYEPPPSRLAKTLPPTPCSSTSTLSFEPASDTEFKTAASSPVQETASGSIDINLFLGPQVFVTVPLSRYDSSLEQLRQSLNAALDQRRLDRLPLPSCLAYHHQARSDRQGALHTLTLNRKEPCVDSDTLMKLASSRSLSFFSNTDTEDTEEDVLLIASDSDLKAALQGRWRRLDHVTVTCLAW